MHRLSRSRHAFTLIELLVVVAIIIVLIAVLVPSLSQARETARSVACLSNERQLGMAMRMYADGHQNRYPVMTNDNWVKPESLGGIWSYLYPDSVAKYWTLYPKLPRSVFHCPTLDAMGTDANGFGNGSAGYGLSEGAWMFRNGTYDSAGPDKALPESDKQRPAETAMLLDGHAFRMRPDHPSGWVASFRHGRGQTSGINVMYFDLHASYEPRGRVPTSIYTVFWTGHYNK